MHSEASYDSKLPISEIEEKTQFFGFKKFGITDHVNFNDEKFLSDLSASAKAVGELKKRCDRVVFGVELTPIEKPEFDYIAKSGTREGYIAPEGGEPYCIELAATKEELLALGLRYTVGASHWRVDCAKIDPLDTEACIKEWYRQQLWLACDDRVTVLGHPWYSGQELWYEDFSVIPRSMNLDIAAALKENGKYAEYNPHFYGRSTNTSEKFRHQYAEFLRELFEMGIPITYGSDAHGAYKADYVKGEKYLVAAGFRDGDFSDIDESHLW
jgi:histidinol phosphatase-like PHP family hydrolase